MKSRSNVGIEALRTLTMLMIISLHYLGHGGLLYAPTASNFQLGWLIESFCYVAVNCYILISGYLLVNSNNFRFKRVFDLWLQVFFYSAGLYLIMLFTYDIPLTYVPFLPIVFKVYWFATGYIGLYLIAPYINKMLRMLDRKDFNRLLVIVFVLLSVLSFAPIDAFQVQGGYSLIWFLGLYVVGAYVRLFAVKLNKVATFTCYVVLSCVTFGVKLVGGSDMLYAYNSVTVFAASVALFMCFKDIKLNVPVLSRLFRFLGPRTFGVYLIHENPYVIDRLWKVLGAEAHYNTPDFIAHFATSVVTVFLVCTGIEHIRQWLFKKNDDNNIRHTVIAYNVKNDIAN